MRAGVRARRSHSLRSERLTRQLTSRSALSGTTASAAGPSLKLASVVLGGLRERGLPCIEAEAANVHVLYEPRDLHRKLMHGASRAQRRVALASLYIGNGYMEGELLAALDRGARETRRTTHIVLDRYGGVSEPPIEWPVARLLREVLGVQHIKGAVFDDDVILTGANLSADYWSARQDRYFCIRGCKELADFVCNLLDGLTQASALDTNRSARSQDSMRHRFTSVGEQGQGAPEAFAVRAALAQACKKSEDLAGRGVTVGRVWFVPVVQMGSAGVCDESETVKWLLHTASQAGRGDQPWSQHQLLMSSPYLNLPSTYVDALLGHGTAANGSATPTPIPKYPPVLLTSAPEANGFFGSGGIRSLIPAAYSAIEHELRARAAAIDSEGSVVPRVRVLHYSRSGWTFHAKGLWLWPLDDITCDSKSNKDTSGHLAFQRMLGAPGTTGACRPPALVGGPVVSLIGSSNLGERSVCRDLELSFILVTTCHKLQTELFFEAQALISYSNEARTHGHSTHAACIASSVTGRLVAKLMHSFL